MANYSFTSFYGEQNDMGVQQPQRPTTYGSNAYQPRMVDPVQNAKQINVYMDLCTRKRVQPQDITKMAVRDLSQEIERLIKLPYPPSQAQIDLIQQLAEQYSMLKYGKKKLYSEEFIAKLTGGREGTASKHIEKLREKIKEFAGALQPTEEQLQKLVSWFYCPDIPFEDEGINRKIAITNEPIKEETRQVGTWTYKAMIAHNQQGQTQAFVMEDTQEVVAESTKETHLYRLLTPNEFAEVIKQAWNKEKADEFISRHSGAFYAWRQTRITPAQMRTIRDIERELSNFSAPKPREEAVDMYGERVDYTLYSSRERVINDNAYEPLSEMQLIQMSMSDASVWIDRLRYERDLAELRTTKDVEGWMNEREHAFYEKMGKYEDKTYTDTDQELLDAEDFSEAWEAHAGMPDGYR